MDFILSPIRTITSPPARKTYLNTLLFTLASAILLFLASLAYILFYLSYVPQIGIERVVHLQYGAGPHPHGIIAIGSALVSQQAYDITLLLNVPRSPPNLERGNFMLELKLLPATFVPARPSTAPYEETTTSPLSLLAPGDTLYSSRRPAILTYTSRLVSLSSRLFSLPLYILNLRRESETLTIHMGESISFPRGNKNVPAWAMVEVQAGQDVQIYDMRLNFKARFRGLRWVMYNHRILSFLVGVGSFWLSEVIAAGLAWVVLSSMFSSTKPAEDLPEKLDGEVEGKRVKEEEKTDTEPDLSDTPRTFPTYGRQPPLRYVPKVKEEVVDSEDILVEQDMKIEADDEDEEEGYKDSGVGTSFSDGTGIGSGLARRRSRGGRLGG